MAESRSTAAQAAVGTATRTVLRLVRPRQAPIYVAGRERDLIRGLKDRNSGPFPTDAIGHGMLTRKTNVANACVGVVTKAMELAQEVLADKEGSDT